MESDAFGEIDDIGLLKEAELFSNMPESVVRTIMLQAKTMKFSAESWVVRRGDPGDSLFVVKSGVVEVLGTAENGAPRTLAYLGRGECLGELAILTNMSRHADVRVPEHAELLVIGKELFQDLLANHPGFGGQLSVILAHRLVKLLQDLPAGANKKELQGNLEYFDLPTVIQTLITSGQSGIMTLTTNGERIGHLYFESGNIARAQFGHRSGDEAVHQLFQAQLNADFLFRSSDSKPQQPDADPNITVPSIHLMIDSVRLQDELAVIKEQLPAPATRLERTEGVLKWPEPEGQKEAEELWSSLKDPTTVGELLEGSPGCHYHVGAVLLRLLETEQLMPTLD